jgi:hypothetical protein
MKNKVLDPVTIKYIAGLENENNLQERLIKNQKEMIHMLEEENTALREQLEKLLKLK